MECYICYDKESSLDKFVKNPCHCKGSNKIHTSCLKKLIDKNGSTCSICKQSFQLDFAKKTNKTYDNYEVDIDYDQELIHDNYTYEDKNISIQYTYIGNGNYKIDYKHKNVCSIS